MHVIATTSKVQESCVSLYSCPSACSRGHLTDQILSMDPFDLPVFSEDDGQHLVEDIHNPDTLMFLPIQTINRSGFCSYQEQK